MPHDSFSFADYPRSRSEICPSGGPISVRVDGWVFDSAGTSEAAVFDDLALYAKRLFDICGAVLLLVILSPIFILVGLVVKLTSTGPVFFTQRRPGRNLVPFTMFKFRTMKAESNHEEEELQRIRNGEFCKVDSDPRITPVGRFLRKCSLDELPQLINVIRGDMSLVGPRPILNCELDCFERSVQMRRFAVRPGITGLWQVSGRSDTNNHKRLMYDLEYIKTWSLLLDLRLLAVTIPAVLKCEGAK